ncbi:aldehyde dehydrogenase family protein [Streptomyces sp. 5-10]|uniref:aldehyde dehydrogenase family protein n=1 Tax=Streptomyces sp. 5-10 TaxID=878925 RepID=UPI00295F4815|nr:aldehyde dehydrogenase family protein [Streptomyces sp. 5-10]
MDARQCHAARHLHRAAGAGHARVPAPAGGTRGAPKRPRPSSSSLRVAGFWNSGQECGAACRVLVHESVAERFVEQLVGEVGALVVGEPHKHVMHHHGR